VVANIITWSGLTRRQDFQVYISFKYIHFFQSLTITFKTTPKYATRHDGDQITFVRFEVLMSLLRIIPSREMWCRVVWRRGTNISGEISASHFRFTLQKKAAV